MKLYFYHLSQPLGEKPRIEVEECEVEERDIFFKVIGNPPKFYNNFRIMKFEIGNLIEVRKEKVLILHERDAKKASDIFGEEFALKIRRKIETICDLKNQIERYREIIDMVDDWRLEHETNQNLNKRNSN